MRNRKWLVFLVSVAVLGSAALAVQIASGGSGGNGREISLVPQPAGKAGAPGPGMRGVEIEGVPRGFPERKLLRVARAAVSVAGGGFVTEIERSDDPDEVWEVEVETDEGEIDVALNAKLARVPNRPYGG